MNNSTNSAGSLHKCLTVAVLPLLTSCSLAMRAAVESDNPGRPSVDVYAWCGVHPDDPHATAKVRSLATDAGIDATFGPCNPPDWSTYTPATPGPRYSDPATYLRLLELNASVGMRTFIYDARLYSQDPAVRDAAIAEWAPHTEWIAGVDIGDEYDTDQWQTLVDRWNIVTAYVTPELGARPVSNHLWWNTDRALQDLSDDTLWFDWYEVDQSVALAARMAPRVDRLVCAVNGLTHGPYVATPASIEDGMRRHVAAGCDAILLFGGEQPISTPGFDVPSLVSASGAPTWLAHAVRKGARS